MFPAMGNITLPPDVLSRIFDCLTLKEIHTCRMVSSAWNDAYLLMLPTFPLLPVSVNITPYGECRTVAIDISPRKVINAEDPIHIDLLSDTLCYERKSPETRITVDLNFVEQNTYPWVQDLDLSGSIATQKDAELLFFVCGNALSEFIRKSNPASIIIVYKFSGFYNCSLNHHQRMTLGDSNENPDDDNPSSNNSGSNSGDCGENNEHSENNSDENHNNNSDNNNESPSNSGGDKDGSGENPDGNGDESDDDKNPTDPDSDAENASDADDTDADDKEEDDKSDLDKIQENPNNEIPFFPNSDDENVHIINVEDYVDEEEEADEADSDNLSDNAQNDAYLQIGENPVYPNSDDENVHIINVEDYVDEEEEDEADPDDLEEVDEIQNAVFLQNAAIAAAAVAAPSAAQNWFNEHFYQHIPPYNYYGPFPRPPQNTLYNYDPNVYFGQQFAMPFGISGAGPYFGPRGFPRPRYPFATPGFFGQNHFGAHGGHSPAEPILEVESPNDEVDHVNANANANLWDSDEEGGDDGDDDDDDNDDDDNNDNNDDDNAKNEDHDNDDDNNDNNAKNDDNDNDDNDAKNDDNDNDDNNVKTDDNAKNDDNDDDNAKNDDNDDSNAKNDDNNALKVESAEVNHVDVPSNSGENPAVSFNIPHGGSNEAIQSYNDSLQASMENNDESDAEPNVHPEEVDLEPLSSDEYSDSDFDYDYDTDLEDLFSQENDADYGLYTSDSSVGAEDSDDTSVSGEDEYPGFELNVLHLGKKPQF